MCKYGEYREIYTPISAVDALDNFLLMSAPN
jgi:hypothetical protein